MVAAATAPGAVSALTVWFYVISIVVMVGGIVLGAIRIAVAWGKARATWEANLEQTRQLRDCVDELKDSVETRFVAVEIRVRDLERQR